MARLNWAPDDHFRRSCKEKIANIAAKYSCISTIERQPQFYQELEDNAVLFDQLLLPEIKKNNWELCFQRVGSMATLFFQKGPVTSYDDALHSDTELFKDYFHSMLDNGFYFPPSQFEAFFLSAAHSHDQVKQAIETMVSFCYKKF